MKAIFDSYFDSRLRSEFMF